VADALPGAFKYSLRAPHDGYDWKGLGRSIETRLDSAIEIRPKANDAVLVTAADEAPFRAALGEEAPDVKIFGWGRTLEVYKDVGHPLEICERYGLPTAAGYQGLGHTRMATESAVTTEHSLTPSAWPRTSPSSITARFPTMRPSDESSSTEATTSIPTMTPKWARA
jgi:hypothetical protein